MAKRARGTHEPDPPVRRRSNGTTADALEERVVAFAEQLGRMIGTIQAGTEGWVDGASLHRQLGRVRDGAAALLEQLAGSSGTPSTPVAARAVASGSGRSGGVVDAPRKKHRKPAPADRRVAAMRSQVAKMRSASPLAKTKQRRGRS